MYSTTTLSLALAALLSSASAYVPRPRGLTARNTTEPCGIIGQGVRDGTLNTMPAELGYRCLSSVPIDLKLASETIESVIRLSEFQSTLAFLRNPTPDYLNPAVDILGELQQIKDNLAAGQYNNEYFFEADIARVIMKANDGHFNWEGNCFSGALLWQRNLATSLMSTSIGRELPKIYTKHGVEAGKASVVTSIDGQDPATLIENEGSQLGYQDPDARWNAMMAGDTGSNGAFIVPNFYPGTKTTMTFANGTTQSLPNIAYPATTDGWESVHDGQSFFNSFCRGSSSNSTLTKRSVEPPKRKHRYPVKYFKQMEALGVEAGFPEKYPTPFINHPEDDVNVAGYFENINGQEVAVLLMSTFEDSDSQFVPTVVKFIQAAKNRNVQRLIIDMRGNPGGLVFYGYEVFKALFPTRNPFGGQRFRANEAAGLITDAFGGLSTSTSDGGSPFNPDTHVDVNLRPFDSEEEFFGPYPSHGDEYTDVYRYSAFQAQLNYTTFLPENIVLFTDGQCSSTCTLFTEFMTQQVSGVHTITIGGRPQYGPMTVPGGVKGSRILGSEEIEGWAVDATKILNNASASEVMPYAAPVQTNFANVNFQDNIRTPEGTVPTHFIYDPSECRIFYTNEMYDDVTLVWKAVYDATWVSNGLCVNGYGSQLPPVNPPCNSTTTVGHPPTTYTPTTIPTTYPTYTHTYTPTTYNPITIPTTIPTTIEPITKPTTIVSTYHPETIVPISNPPTTYTETVTVPPSTYTQTVTVPPNTYTETTTVIVTETGPGTCAPPKPTYGARLF